MLHITNGDCAVAALRPRFAGEWLAWRDVLHEGPVRAGLSLEALSRERTAFIAQAGWGAPAQVERQFTERDAQLRNAAEHDEVVLWFEHDLYDQLQLLQLLDWFSSHPHPGLSLVCEARYLGMLKPQEACLLFMQRQAVDSAQLAAGAATWRAFSEDPRRLTAAPVASLPYLGAALRRLLEELPWTRDGLSRLERQVLAALRCGALPFDALFARVQEEPRFLGDAVLRWRLEGLASDGIISGGAAWRLTPHGRDILEGRRDAWAAPRGARWLGGYRITDGEPRWDPASASVCG